MALWLWLQIPGAVPGHAQEDPAARYQEGLNHYIQADFEQAAVILERVRNHAVEPRLKHDAAAVEAVCLAVLGRRTQAEQVLTELFQERPDYQPPPEIASPWVRKLFETVRRRAGNMGEVERWNQRVDALLQALASRDIAEIPAAFARLRASTWKHPKILAKLRVLDQRRTLSGELEMLSSFTSRRVRIPGGEAYLGVGRRRRKVHLSPYYLDKYPVTWEDYVQARKRHDQSAPAIPPGKARHPVTGVTWKEASIYCEWAGGQLPTRDQWEFAARGNQGLAFPYGRSFDAHRCNTRESGLGDTTPVDYFTAGKSPFGIYDMCGNTWEWTATPAGKGKYILKGGSFREKAEAALTYASREHDGNVPAGDIGFRCAAPPDALDAVLRRLQAFAEQLSIPP